MHTENLWIALQYMLYFGSVEVAPVSSHCHFPCVVMFMVDLFPVYIHINKFGRLYRWNIRLMIWATNNSSDYFFPMLSMHASAFWKLLQSMLYLVTLYMAPVPANLFFPCNMVFMEHIWTASNHNNKVVRLSWLNFVVAI